MPQRGIRPPFRSLGTVFAMHEAEMQFGALGQLEALERPEVRIVVALDRTGRCSQVIGRADAANSPFANRTRFVVSSGWTKCLS